MARMSVSDVVAALLKAREGNPQLDACLLHPYLDSPELRAALGEHGCAVRVHRWAPPEYVAFMDSEYLDKPPMFDQPSVDL